MDHAEQMIAWTRFFAGFLRSPEWQAMERTVENSPWHREANVAVHTQMLITHYLTNIARHRDPRQRTLTLVACLFHDVGKPPAEIVKFSEERGEYRAYHGHEQLSARMWVNYALAHRLTTMEALDLSVEDVSHIAFMIEHHVPFALKDERKRRALKLSMINRGVHQEWLDLLESDQNGRTSDGQDAKLAAVAAWLEEWRKL